MGQFVREEHAQETAYLRAQLDAYMRAAVDLLATQNRPPMVLKP